MPPGAGEPLEVWEQKAGACWRQLAVFPYAGLRVESPWQDWPGLGLLGPGKPGSPFTLYGTLGAQKVQRGLAWALLVPLVWWGLRVCPAYLPTGPPTFTPLGAVKREGRFEGISPGSSLCPWLQLALALRI